MVRRPLGASNISAAVIYRVTEKYKPTLVIDEFDSFGTNNEDLRNMINGGHDRSAMERAWRCAPDTHEPESFDTFCPKAIDLIGKLKPSMRDRSIVIDMERKALKVKVAPLRDTLLAEYETLRRKLFRWASDHKDEIRGATPVALHRSMTAPTIIGFPCCKSRRWPVRSGPRKHWKRSLRSIPERMTMTQS
jgi:putative DNA primase/helicase